jgi:accessory gene regulator B
MEEWARKLAELFQRNLDLNTDQTEVAAYAITSLCLLVITFVLIVTICRIFTVVPQGLVVTLTAAVMRSVTGGAHLSSPWRCILLSTILPVVLALFAKNLGPSTPSWLLLLFLLFTAFYGVFVIRRYAPAEVKEKPIKPEKRGYYRVISYIFGLLWLLFSFYLFFHGASHLLLATILGFFWQMATLTPFGFSVYHRLSKICVKEGAR